MKTKMISFYEVLQLGGSGAWIHLAFFRDKKSAETFKTGFNIGTSVSPIKILKRNFLDEKVEEQD